MSHYDTFPVTAAMAGDGIEIVIHKATEGVSDKYNDTAYNQKKGQAKKVALLWGAYHFARPLGFQDPTQKVFTEDPVSQADHFIEQVLTNREQNDDKILLAFDLEETNNQFLSLWALERQLKRLLASLGNTQACIPARLLFKGTSRIPF
jgi:GH25 family lysozyme M1 (1,4-beta-N-acetylmuramidase)